MDGSRRLSERRATSVRSYLIRAGLASTRLESAGIGEEKPIDTNDTPEGRQNNRRVEFVILDQGTCGNLASSVNTFETDFSNKVENPCHDDVKVRLLFLEPMWMK
ncbi:MAG: OmpA family protein [Deltaproteobacteria bacterium]|nr:OmpA family protein [Deltaproteobacteria bacterium]